jgi:hypothetical protein
MHRLVPVVVTLLALGSSAPTAAGQVTTPVGSPAAVTCTAPPLASNPPVRRSTPGGEETEPATTVASDAEAALPPRTPPPGTPAGTALLEHIHGVEENIANCFNAGDSLAFTALFTPKALLAESGLSDPRATPAHSASYLILREQLLSVTDAQTHDDGRVSADVVFAFEGEQMRARDIFVEMDGWLLLDEVIELPLESATPTPAPLDETTLQNLTILGFAPGNPPGIIQLGSLGATIAMHPGDTRALVLGVLDYEVCGGIGFRCFVPVPAPATWSVAPTAGSRIDAADGLLTIDPATASGSVFTVRAEVEGGRHVVEKQVYVYTPEANPLVGFWQEVAQLSCDTGAEVAPALPIEELVFGSDGTFTVTWTPFESYVDYWGTYSFDLSQGTLELTVTGGNTIPPDVDGHGQFMVDASGRLILTDLWLGASRQESGPPNCGHRFAG